MTPFHFFVLVLICIVWGMHFTVIKLTVSNIDPLFYVAVRMTIVAAVLVPFLKWHKGVMGKILIAGAGFGGLNYAFTFTGVKFTSASVGAILMESYVPIATILSVIFLKERIGWRRILGLVLALLGVVIIVTAGEEHTGADRLILGAMLLLAGASCEAIAAVTIKKIDSISPYQMLAWFGLIGAVIGWVSTFTLEQDQMAFWATDQKWLVVLTIGYSVFLASIFGHASYYWLLQRVDVSLVAGGTVMTTVFAVFFGVTLLGEPLTIRLFLGAVVVLVGVGIIVIRSNAKRAQPMAVVSEAMGQEVGAKQEDEGSKS